ncbi:hypothetical protein CspeluHIS016_0402720 [Cutaneotrichosporon spelunceum]|uniref:Uncharacterized protein n=1 Tax=Cutaneotrichosporon spelunceum TaxID=1672016 RepID=A0AAD3TVK2_9TREE|nr:hypothetical protein CspeluHIS016_0402720 [Cutaneotrichosporon spelunceum]
MRLPLPTALALPLTLALALPSAPRPLYDLDPRDVNPPRAATGPGRPAPDAATVFGMSKAPEVTVFSMGMSPDGTCAGAHMLGAYNMRNGLSRRASPGSGVCVRVAGAPCCRVHIYVTADCRGEIGVANVEQPSGEGEGVCVYPGMGLAGVGEWSAVPSGCVA